jgi:hypothetical protein
MDNEGSTMDRARLSRGALAGISGLLAGTLTGVALAVLAGAAIAQRSGAGSPVLEATHLPPLLTAAGEEVDLRYDVYCAPPDADLRPGADCEAGGTVFVRVGTSGPFRELPLRVDTGAVEGRLAARLPEGIADSPSGFSYYAALNDPSSGATLTLPSGGPEAPQRSLPLAGAVDVRIGAHEFGAVSHADARVVDASWGSGTGEVGLEQGRNLSPMGGSAFDVDRNRAVYVLDEANRRLLRWRDGVRVPTHVPLAIDGTLADMSVGGDGTIYVLETASGVGRSPLLRVFGADGAARGTSEIAERASQVRVGPEGAVALQQPSGQWMTAATGGRPLTPSDQRASGRPGRPIAGGDEVVVLRRGNEIRAAVVGPEGARRAWRITSETPLAEVQLAEPRGKFLVLVARVYTDDRDEFVALVLGERGLVRKLALEPADWAETAPLSRFRLAGSSLYQLGSTPDGLFVDRFDLEVS